MTDDREELKALIRARLDEAPIGSGLMDSLAIYNKHGGGSDLTEDEFREVVREVGSERGIAMS